MPGPMTADELREKLGALDEEFRAVFDRHNRWWRRAAGWFVARLYDWMSAVPPHARWYDDRALGRLSDLVLRLHPWIAGDWARVVREDLERPIYVAAPTDGPLGPRLNRTAGERSAHTFYRLDPVEDAEGSPSGSRPSGAFFAAGGLWSERPPEYEQLPVPYAHFGRQVRAVFLHPGRDQ